MNPHFANLETSLSARAATIEAIHQEVAAARATARSRAYGHAFKMIGVGHCHLADQARCLQGAGPAFGHAAC